MAKYSERAKEALLQYPLINVLARYGKRVDRPYCAEARIETGNFYSPFREESAPSFHIDAQKNLYYDYGEGKGGNALTLVARLEGCTLDKAWDILADFDRSSVELYPADDERNMVRSRTSSAVTKKAEPKNVVTKVYDSIFNKEAVKFLNDRFIPDTIAELYCKQVHFTCDGRKSIAIGFPNCTGGWALRGEHEWNGKVYQIKKCTNQAVTYIDSAGQFCENAPNTSDKLAVFEGFFDFLSWTAMRSGWKPGMKSPVALLPKECDVVVLNSCGNWSRAMNAYICHTTIYSFLDDDKKGRETAKELRDNCEGVGAAFIDCSQEGVYGRTYNGVEGDVADAWKDYCLAYVEHRRELNRQRAEDRYKAEWERGETQSVLSGKGQEQEWVPDWRGSDDVQETKIGDEYIEEEGESLSSDL